MYFTTTMFTTVLVMWAKKVNRVHFNFMLTLIETGFVQQMDDIHVFLLLEKNSLIK